MLFRSQLAAAILFLDVLNMIAFTKLRLERRAWYFAGVRAFSIVINVVLNVVFLAVLHRGPNSILWANIGASLASLLVLAPVWGSELKGHNPLHLIGTCKKKWHALPGRLYRRAWQAFWSA